MQFYLHTIQKDRLSIFRKCGSGTEGHLKSVLGTFLFDEKQFDSSLLYLGARSNPGSIPAGKGDAGTGNCCVDSSAWGYEVTGEDMAK